MSHSVPMGVDVESMDDSAGVIHLSRNLSMAREAFAKGDVEKSRLAHQAIVARATGDDTSITGPNHAREEHSKSGEYVRSIVFGGMDGIITTFAIVAGSHGASLSAVSIMVLGVSNIIGDGISMGFGDFISLQAEAEFARKEWKREKFELENYPEGEKLEMVELYMAKGMSCNDASQMIDIMAKYTNLFVDHMVVHELGLSVPDENAQHWKHGLVTFMAFCVFGFVPLLSYIAFHALKVKAGFDLQFLIACILTAVALFVLGVYKSRFVSARWWTSGLWVLLNGALAAGAAYFIGWGMAAILGGIQQCA